MNKLFELINKETKQQNETKRMTVILRQLCIIFALLSFGNLIINLFLIHSITGAFMWLAMMGVDGLTLYISYSASKKVLVSIFAFQKIIWILTAILLYGWESGFQFFLVLLAIIYSFGEAGYNKKKLMFNFLCFVLFVVFLEFFKGGEGKISIENVDRMIQILNTLAFAVTVSIISFSFSRESQQFESKLEDYNRKLQREASVDALTGLNNRRSTTEYINDLIKDNRVFSICICDIDHFKRVNDTYGHEVGDDVLVAISVVFKKTIEGQGFVASRWGGEEFLLVFPDLNGDEAYMHVHNLKSEIKKIEVPCNDDIITITMTYGLTEFDLDKDMDTNIKEADDKLYLGKENGRDRIIY